MDDLISRQAAIDAICEHGVDLERRGITVLAVVNHKQVTVDLLEELPSAERHGRWEHLGGDEWFCTACGHVITTEGSWERPWQKYCEECGARMEATE